MPTSRARTAICSAPLECPSRPGLPTRIFIAPAERVGRRGRPRRAAPRARRRRRRPGARLADAGRRAVVAEDVAQRLRPLAGRHAGAGGGDRRGHDVLVVVAAPRAAARRARASTARRVALRAPLAQRRDLLGLDAGVDGEDPAVGALRRAARARSRVAVLPDDDRARRPRCGGSARGASRRAPPSCTAPPRPRRRAPRRSPSRRARRRRSSATRPSMTFEPSKMSGYSSRSVS